MRMSELHAEQDEQRQANGWEDYLAWEASEQELNEIEKKGQPSPVNDGIFKGN